MTARPGAVHRGLGALALVLLVATGCGSRRSGEDLPAAEFDTDEVFDHDLGVA